MARTPRASAVREAVVSTEGDVGRRGGSRPCTAEGKRQHRLDLLLARRSNSADRRTFEVKWHKVHTKRLFPPILNSPRSVMKSRSYAAQAIPAPPVECDAPWEARIAHLRSNPGHSTFAPTRAGAAHTKLRALPAADTGCGGALHARTHASDGTESAGPPRVPSLRPLLRTS